MCLLCRQRTFRRRRRRKKWGPKTVSKFVFNPQWMKMNVSSQNAYECTTCLKPKKKKRNEKELILATYKMRKGEKNSLPSCSKRKPEFPLRNENENVQWLLQGK